jgi:hypothetical protein
MLFANSLAVLATDSGSGYSAGPGPEARREFPPGLSFARTREGSCRSGRREVDFDVSVGLECNGLGLLLA